MPCVCRQAELRDPMCQEKEILDFLGQQWILLNPERIKATKSQI